jgi:peptide/nickel transport system permease protein
VWTIIPFSPNDRLRDRPQETLTPPSATHWLGTTEFGEDMLSRMLHACRVTLAIGLIATGISTAVGIVVGGVLGYYGGWTDLIGMRVVEIVEAIPRLILLLIVMVSFGRSLYLMMIVIGLVVWTSDARFIRAEFLKLRNLDFVQAAIAAGLSRRSIIFRHMLPNGVAPVLVNASFGIAWAILYESVLSFLGLGLGPDDPSWGQLLEQSMKGGTGFNWWIATFPGLAIFLTVFAYILIGEAMRDAIDPKLQKRE